MIFYLKYYLYQVKQSITYNIWRGCLGLRKLQITKKSTYKRRKETIGSIFYINFEKLSDKQKKMFQDLYLENLREGLKPKEAMDKAFQIVTCFKM